jgi:hypothetical protein
MNRTAIVIGLGIAASAAVVSVLAGPLNPPVGPVASSLKTLTEVEPRVAVSAVNTPGDNDSTPSLYKITQPGSYYLTGNITGAIGKAGIEIVASHVTLDLHGFELVGVIDGNGNGSLDGVAVYTAGRTNISIVNGTVRNWPMSGISMPTYIGSSGCRVERVRASDNTTAGIIVPPASIVAGCTVVGGSTGIRAGVGGVVTECSVTGTSVYGIFVDFASTLKDSTAHFNNGTGIYANEGSTVSNCNAFVSGNKGILTNGGVTVVGCTVHVATSDGIYCASNSVIRDNTIVGAGQGGDGANIYLNGSDNRVEGNNCTAADRGIQAVGTGNIILRNSCSGNTTDWVLAANNVFGAIIDRRAPASGSVNGFSAPSSLGSTDPNANFSY